MNTGRAQLIHFVLVNLNQLYIPTLLHLGQISDAAVITCAGNQYFYSSLTDGNITCRTCSSCQPGQYVVSPCDGNSDVICANCPARTYSDDTSECINCTVCDRRHIEIISCTTTTDTVCSKCSSKQYIKNRKCWKCNNCPPGYYTKTACGMTSDTVCDICPPYTYSKRYGVSRCKPCRPCRHFEEVLNLCNTTSNVLCGECKKEYYRDGITGECLRCSECYNEYESVNVRIPECFSKTSDPGKICMPIFPPPYRKVNQSQMNVSLEKPDSISVEERSSFVLVFEVVSVVSVVSICISLIAIVMRNRLKWYRLKSTNDRERKKPAEEHDSGSKTTHEDKWINETTEQQKFITNKATVLDEIEVSENRIDDGKGFLGMPLNESGQFSGSIPKAKMFFYKQERKRRNDLLLLRHSDSILLTDTGGMQMYRGNQAYEGCQAVSRCGIVRSASYGDFLPSAVDV